MESQETFIERKNYNNHITVKLVFPSVCNYHCVFCYNRDKELNAKYENGVEFCANFIDSLDNLIQKIGDQNPISLDITGGEPTLDVALFIDVMRNLRDYHIQDKVSRVTLTTNGTHLQECIPYMEGVVNYVNISVHDFDILRRANIVNSPYMVPGFTKYSDLVEELHSRNIPVSASAVIYKEIENFGVWRDTFITWAKCVGFIALRFRCDVFWKDTKFDEYMKETCADARFQVLVHEKTPDSHWCRLRMADKFRVFFLHGVLDTSLHTKGIEYIIDSDGKCYCDYYRRTPIEKYEYPIGRIFDKDE